MGFAFFGLALLLFLLTLNSFRPVRRNRVLYAPSFFASWLTNELAPFYLLTLAAFGVAGALILDVQASVLGWVSLGLVVVSWMLLVVLYRRGRRTRVEVVDALGEYGSAQPAPRHPRRSRYVKEKNVTFARVGGRRLRLDVTRPTDHAEGDPRPAILQIHGGGWVIGDKREQGLPLLRRLASNGWVGFNANYRLSPGATWPDHLVDCKRALAWIRAHAEEYNVDPDFVAVTGGSAGGHLTAMMALTADDASLQPGFEDVDCSLQAAVPFYGVYDFTNRSGHAYPEMLPWVLEPLVMKAFYDEEPEKFHAASPLDRVHAGAPPFFVLHGDKDTLAPVEDAREFVRRLAEVSRNEVFYAELAGAQHAFDLFSSPRARRALAGVQRFLFETHARYVADRPTTAAPVATPEVERPSVEDRSDSPAAAPSR